MAKTLYILKGLYYNTIAKYTCKSPLETCMVTLWKDQGISEVNSSINWAFPHLIDSDFLTLIYFDNCSCHLTNASRVDFHGELFHGRTLKGRYQVCVLKCFPDGSKSIARIAQYIPRISRHLINDYVGYSHIFLIFLTLFLHLSLCSAIYFSAISYIY